MREITEENEVPISFQTPAKAFYVTSPVWKSSTEKIILNEDSLFCMGGDYIPVPFEDFANSIVRLSEMRAIRMYPGDLTERLDYDPLEVKKNHEYLLMGNVLMRVRKDETSKLENMIHTLMMLGDKENILELTKKIELPNPFEISGYKYKNQFSDPSGRIRILR